MYLRLNISYFPFIYCHPYFSSLLHATYYSSKLLNLLLRDFEPFLPIPLFYALRNLHHCVLRIDLLVSTVSCSCQRLLPLGLAGDQLLPIKVHSWTCHSSGDSTSSPLLLVSDTILAIVFCLFILILLFAVYSEKLIREVVEYFSLGSSVCKKLSLHSRLDTAVSERSCPAAEGCRDTL